VLLREISHEGARRSSSQLMRFETGYARSDVHQFDIDVKLGRSRVDEDHQCPHGHAMSFRN
jgi:hypothetical protein